MTDEKIIIDGKEWIKVKDPTILYHKESTDFTDGHLVLIPAPQKSELDKAAETFLTEQEVYRVWKTYDDKYKDCFESGALALLEYLESMVPKCRGPGLGQYNRELYEKCKKWCGK